jgi:hypothetical protein
LTFNNTVLGVGQDSWSSGIMLRIQRTATTAGLLSMVGCDHPGSERWGLWDRCWIHPPNEQPNRDYNIRDLWISTQYYSQGCPSGCAQQWNELLGTNVWQNVRKYDPGQPDHGQQIGS